MLWSKQDLGQHQLCDRVTSGELSRSLSWYVTVVQLVTLFHGFLEQDKEVSEGKKKGWKGGSMEGKHQKSPGPATSSMGDSRPAAPPAGVSTYLSVKRVQHHCAHLSETIGARGVKVRHAPKARGRLGGPGYSWGRSHQEAGASQRWGRGGMAYQLCSLPGLAPGPSPWGGRQGRGVHGSPEASKKPSKTLRWPGQEPGHTPGKYKATCMQPRATRPHEPRVWGWPCLQTITLRAGFPGDAFVLPLRRGREKSLM